VLIRFCFEHPFAGRTSLFQVRSNRFPNFVIDYYKILTISSENRYQAEARTGASPVAFYSRSVTTQDNSDIDLCHLARLAIPNTLTGGVTT
jgi:hypothetical protein